MSSSKYLGPLEGDGESQPPSPAAEVSPPPKDAERKRWGPPREHRPPPEAAPRRKCEPGEDRSPIHPPPPPPTLAESHPLARELLDAGGKVIHETLSCWVVKYARGTRVTKFHISGIRPAEVEVMRFVSEHTTIPVPRVYDVGERHFTMEFMEGETLKKAWENTLSVEDRALVARQLRDYINQLRVIKSPDGAICSSAAGLLLTPASTTSRAGCSPTRLRTTIS